MVLAHGYFNPWKGNVHNNVGFSVPFVFELGARTSRKTDRQMAA